MTEEEYFRKNYPNYCYGFEKRPLSPYWDLFQDGVEFGERQSEKKIEELERKLEQTEKDLADYQFNYPKIKELETENNKLLDVINNQDVKIADLEKQITALEAKNTELSENWRADHDTLVFYDEKLEKENAELRIQNTNANLKGLEMQVAKDSHRDRANKLQDQLTKAKEIIIAFVKWANWEGSDCPNFKSIQDKAEQFLKEIEK